MFAHLAVDEPRSCVASAPGRMCPVVLPIFNLCPKLDTLALVLWA